MIVAEGKFHIALHGDFVGVFHGLRRVGENLAHFVFAFQVKLVVWKAHPLLVVDGGSRLNGQQHIVGLCVLLPHIVDIVGGSQRNVQLLGKLDKLGIYHSLFFQPLVLQLQIKIAVAENLV